MKKYFAPEVDIYNFRLVETVLTEGGSNTYTEGDEIINDGTTDPFA